MKWYYADGGRQVGPVEEPALDDLVRAGTVRDDTLVWREGMATWQPHSAVRGAQPPPPMPAGAGTSFCSECGRPFPPDQLVMVGNAAVCATCKPIFLQRLREGGQVVGARRYAGFWIRFVARVIDFCILAVVGLIVRIPLAMSVGFTPGRFGAGGLSPGALPLILGLGGITALLQLAIQVAYEAYFLSTRGATPGKLALGLRVIRSDGSGIPPGLAVGRYFAQYISAFILLIGYIMAAFDSEKRSLHDRICDTRVIYSN